MYNVHYIIVWRREIHGRKCLYCSEFFAYRQTHTSMKMDMRLSPWYYHQDMQILTMKVVQQFQAFQNLFSTSCPDQDVA